MGDTEDSTSDFVASLSSIDLDACTTHVKRAICARCERPEKVCWCPQLPEEPLETSTSVFILQHPNEEKRNVRTAPILRASLKKCFIIRGRNFARHPLLQEAYQNEDRTYVLYPSPSAIDVESLGVMKGFNLIVIDGTWNQAKGLYYANKKLHSLPKVSIKPVHPSYYVVRTQPHSDCLSTVESVALALSKLEGKPELNTILVRPLVAMCAFQIEHGAEKHESKEQQILSGTFKKKIPRKIENRIKLCKDFRNLLFS